MVLVITGRKIINFLSLPFSIFQKKKPVDWFCNILIFEFLHKLCIWWQYWPTFLTYLYCINPFYIIERNDEIDDVSETNNATSEPKTSNNKEEGNNDKTLEKSALRLKEYIRRINYYRNYFSHKTSVWRHDSRLSIV